MCATVVLRVVLDDVYDELRLIHHDFRAKVARVVVRSNVCILRHHAIEPALAVSAFWMLVGNVGIDLFLVRQYLRTQLAYVVVGSDVSISQRQAFECTLAM
jgi:hypothetical protein